MTWDVPIRVDGALEPAFLEQLRAVGKALPRN